MYGPMGSGKSSVAFWVLSGSHKGLSIKRFTSNFFGTNTHVSPLLFFDGRMMPTAQHKTMTVYHPTQERRRTPYSVPSSTILLPVTVSTNQNHKT